MADAILLYGDTLRHPNILWRTRFSAPDPVLYVESGERRILLVGGMEVGRAEKEADVSEVRQFDDQAWRDRLRDGSEYEAHAVTIAGLLAELGTDTVTVEPDFPVAMAMALDARDVVVGVNDDLFRAERRRKSGDEQEAVARSQAAAVSAMRAARAVLHDSEARDGKVWYHDAPLTSDILVGVIEQDLLRHNCVTDETIVAGGPGAADPHTARTGHLDAGVGIIIDIFPSSKETRYFGDITRTYVVGEPTEAWLREYEAVRTAQQAALSMLRAGVSSRAVHRQVCQTLYDAGYGTTVDGLRREGVAIMNHGTGHGLGLMIHEAPRINDFEGTLQEGDVVTVEPGLYSATDGSVRLENTVVITLDGYRELTDIDLEWRP
ncbi:MAG: M24 family metallopeptidase [Candidatus Dormibacteraeota bacterium]|nr:M24 family metallopeptidase [Candidatus Dormibacteraeota bacterium]